jgi:hypothetical protein
MTQSGLTCSLPRRGQGTGTKLYIPNYTPRSNLSGIAEERLAKLHASLGSKTLKRELPADSEPAYDGLGISLQII